MEIKYISINNIYVNPENPRHNPTIDDITAINVLINENQTDMLELLRSINRDGFFAQKVVSLIEKNQKLVAIDGNRRVAAIKCLLNPDIIIDKVFRKKVERIEPDQISSRMLIPCVKYEKITDALPFILSEHTEGSQTRKWSRIQQYYFMLQYGSRNDVPRIFLLYHDNFPRERNSTIENFSTIERIIKKAEFERLANLDTETLKKVLWQFVEDTNNGGYYTSRTLNETKQIKEYFNNVLENCVLLTSPTSMGQPHGDFGNRQQSAETSDSGSAAYNGHNVKPIPTVHAFEKLTWKGLDAHHPMTKSIIDVAKEVKQLAKKYDQFPIATTVLIRSLFELVLKYWLSTRRNSLYIKLQNNAHGSAKDPQLSEIIAEIRRQLQGHNSIFNLDIDNSFLIYFSENEKTMKDRMDILIHRPWELGTHAQTYKLYDDDVICKIIMFILNTK